MKIAPLTINVINKWKYGQIAFLVDRDDFLSDIEFYREHLGLQQPNQRKNLSKDISSPSFAGVINVLLNKYHKSINYTNVIEQALRTSIICEEDLILDTKKKSTSVIYPEKQDDIRMLTETEIAIIVTPETKKKDIEKIYDGLEKYKKRHSEAWKISDTITNIKRDRDWYWMHKNGMSYSKILQTTKNIGLHGVIEAIKQYKKRLAIKL